MEDLSSKRREVCSLLQATETQELYSLISYLLNCVFEDFYRGKTVLSRQ